MLCFHKLFSKQKVPVKHSYKEKHFFLLWVYAIYIAMVIVVVIEFMGVALLLGLN